MVKYIMKCNTTSEMILKLNENVDICLMVLVKQKDKHLIFLKLTA